MNPNKLYKNKYIIYYMDKKQTKGLQRNTIDKYL